MKKATLRRILPATLVVLPFFSEARQLVSSYVGAFGLVLGALAAYALPFAYVANLIVFETGNHKRVPVARTYLIFLGLWTSWMAVHSLLLSNPSVQTIKDGLAIFYVFSAFVLGRHDTFWDAVRWPIAAMAAVSVAAALPRLGSAAADRGKLHGSLGYRVRGQLDAAPVFSGLGALIRDEFYFTAIMIAALLVLALEILFQKRAPSVRMVLEISVGVLFLFSAARRNPRRLLSLLALGIITLAGISVFLATHEASLQGLFQRFEGSYGVADTVVSNDRLFEAHVVMDELRISDWLAGLGLGGFISAPALSDFVEGLTARGENAHFTTHIGLLTLVIKGGIPYVGLYLFPLLGTIYFGMKKYRRLDPITKTAMFMGPISFGFLLIEGAPSSSTTLNCLLAGLLLSRFQNASVL